MKFFSKFKKILLFVFIYFIYCIVNNCFGQDLPQNIQQKLDEYNLNAERQINEGNPDGALRAYNTSANMLLSSGYLKQAITYYEKILELNKQKNNKGGVAKVQNQISQIYSELEMYEKAIEYLKPLVEYYKNIRNKESYISALYNTATAYRSLKDYNESNIFVNEAIDIAKQLKDPFPWLAKLYKMGANNYKDLGDTDKFNAYADDASTFENVIKKRELEKASQAVKQAENETKLTKEELKHTTEEFQDSLLTYEELTREQQLEIDLKETQLKASKAEARAKDAKLRLARLRIWGLLIGLAITLTFILLLRKANKEIRFQRDILERQNKNINASIRYAETIQQAMLPDENTLSKYFDTFIFFKPKDIVSGDFYWFSGFERRHAGHNKFFVAVVDCTGHGVPGAFMSLIGNRLLSDVVNERGINDPKEILEILNKEVRIALRQDKTDNNDGMDLAICSFEKINRKETKMIFAGAKRNIYVKKIDQFMKFKGDRRSLGGFVERIEGKQFTNHEIILNKDDIIYLFTDGVIDQNGKERKRFGSQYLEEVLQANKDFSMDEQKTKFENELIEYMGEKEQRDDITLIGLKLK